MEGALASRGISLRKKSSARPKIGAPQPLRQISGPVQTQSSLQTIDERPRPALDSKQSSSNHLAIPRERQAPSAGGTSADYIKRRYSTFNNLSTTSEAPDIPSLPGHFGQPPPRDARRLENGGTEKPTLDARALQDPDLRAEQYVAQLLANASEQDIREFQQDLGRVRDRTSTDLQHNVYQNRNQFIKISQEAEKLKTEMRALRGLMSDLTNTLAQTNAALGIDTDNVNARKYANRSSVANLEALWSSHLQELWRRVEGSQKFLPAIPGRHVVHESGRWVELNTATWKPRRRVHLIMLNDHLLVAAEKKRSDAPPTPEKSRGGNSASQQVQFVADRCFPLQDVEMSDLTTKSNERPLSGDTANRPTTLNAVNVSVGLESYTYAVIDPNSSEKATLLGKFRKELATLLQSVRAEHDEDRMRRGSSGRPLSTPADGFLNGASHQRGGSTHDASANTTSKGPPITDLDGRNQPFRYLESLLDTLDIDIALQRFASSVDSVTNLRAIALLPANANNSACKDLVDVRVAARAAKLAKLLLKQLIEKSSFASASTELVGWLQRLGFEKQAAGTYLSARGDVVRERAGACTNTGNLAQHLYELSYVTFTLIKNTLSTYQGCFSPVLSSLAVRWAKEHVEVLNGVMKLQLGSSDISQEERKECVERARECAEALREVGVSFGGIVGRGVEGVE
jgi:hypothetical protein